MERKRSRWIIAATVIVALVLLMTSYYWFVATEQVTGNVDHKSITGIKDGTSYTLVSFNPGGLVVKAEDLSDFFVGMDLNMTVTSDLEREIMDHGYEVHYVGNVRISSPDPVNGLVPGDTRGYFVSSRDDFNRLALGKNVTIGVAHNQMNTIRWVNP